MTPAVEALGLTKVYPAETGYARLLPRRRRPPVVALRDVTFEAERGEVFGLLGLNGAGKTTLLKVLATLVLPTAGGARVLGFDVARQPRRVVERLALVLNEERSLYWRLTGRENLRFFATLYGVPGRTAGRRVAELLELVGLGEAADRRVQHYSSGMRQRLLLARGLLAEPQVLLLDEPTRSMDPLGAAEVRRFVRRELAERRGVTVVVATHSLEEARSLCHRLTVLHRGRVLACGTPAELAATVNGHRRCTLTVWGAPPDLAQRLAVVAEVRGASQEGGLGTLELAVRDHLTQVPLVVEQVVAAGGRVVSCAVREPSLEEALHRLVDGRG